jgi:hypothetical protein
MIGKSKGGCNPIQDEIKADEITNCSKVSAVFI